MPGVGSVHRRSAVGTLAILIGTLLLPSNAQALTPGWLDSTYGGDFQLGLEAPPLAAAVDSSGRVLVTVETGPSRVVRLTVDGGVDSGFGSAGSVDLPTGPNYEAMLVGNDGIYVAGRPASGNGVAIVRLTPAGVVDGTYGSGGLATVAIPALISDVVDLTQLDNGDVVVAAVHNPAPRRDYLAAVTSSGSLDPTWNATGPTPGARTVPDQILAVTHAGNAAAVAGTGTGTGTGTVPHLRQYAANGAPDASFGSAGVVTLPASLAGARVDVGSDGNYYLAATSVTGANATLSVARVLASDGTLDSTFGVAGIARVRVDGVSPGALTVTAGPFVYVFTGGPQIVRLSADGAVDLSYGAAGVLSGFPALNANSRISGWLSGGVQPSGKAVTVFATVDDDAFALPRAIRVNTVSSAPAGSFVPLLPFRALDTRTGIGAPRAAIGPGGSVSLQVGVGVSAVVMTVTAVSPTRTGFVTVYPSGTTRPTASNLNHPAGATTPNLVTVPVGADGKVVLYNGSAGTTHLLADLLGFYLGGTPAVPGAFAGLPPARILDTRTGTGAPHAMVPAGGTLTLTVAGRGGVPASGVSAVVLNATVVGPTMPGYLTIFPGGSTRPNVSNLNFYPGGPRANLATVRLGAGGALSLYNAAAAPVDLVADVAGYYLDGTPTAPGTFVAVDPLRILDTRSFTNPHGIPVHATLVVAPQFLPFQGKAAYVLNATVTRIQQPGFATFRGGSARGPFDTSTLNFVAGQTTASLTVTAGDGVVVYNGVVGHHPRDR